MSLRFSADYRTLLWVAAAPGVVGIQYARPDLVPFLCPLSAYLALACGVIAHNHNHCPTFSSRRANDIFGNWISIFYGYPVFGWIPTHNLNHHKYVNTPGDATITWRYSNRHNLLVALTYFFVSAYFQGGPIRDYIAAAKRRGGPAYRRILTQYFVWAGAHVTMLALAIALHGLTTGLFVYGLSMLMPAFFALFTIMLFNYEQHVHTDPWSDHNHSRNFVSPTLNFLLFNNGYHAAHHEQPGKHWSKLAEVHAAIAPKIDPALNQRSLWAYWLRQYFLAPLFPSLGTRQMGRGPMELGQGRSVRPGHVAADMPEIPPVPDLPLGARRPAGKTASV